MPRASPILYERAYRHFSPLTLRTVFTPERTLVSDTLTVLSTFEEEDFTQSAKEMIPKPPSEVGYGGKSGYRLAEMMGISSARYETIIVCYYHIINLNVY